MRPLKFPLLWITLGWLMVAAACVGALVPGYKVPLVGQYDKLIHGGTYLVLMLWFAGIYERSRYLLIAAALALLGVSLEFGQRLVRSRAFDGYDLSANLVGVVVGLTLAATFLGSWCQQVEGWLFRVRGGP